MASRATRCHACVAIREGRALDVVELDAASNNRVDDMRELLPRVCTAPRTCAARSSSSTRSSGSRRAGTSCSRPSRSRPTTSSSCSARPTRRHPAGRPLPPSSGSTSAACGARDRGQARTILEADGRRRSRTRSTLIARLAAGGMRDAESMLDQLLVGRRRAASPPTRPRPARASPTTRRSTGSSPRSSAGTRSPGSPLLDALEDAAATSGVPRPGGRRAPGARWSRRWAAARRAAALGRGPPRSPPPRAASPTSIRRAAARAASARSSSSRSSAGLAPAHGAGTDRGRAPPRPARATPARARRRARPARGPSRPARAPGRRRPPPAPVAQDGPPVDARAPRGAPAARPTAERPASAPPAAARPHVRRRAPPRVRPTPPPAAARPAVPLDARVRPRGAGREIVRARRAQTRRRSRSSTGLPPVGVEDGVVTPRLPRGAGVPPDVAERRSAPLSRRASARSSARRVAVRCIATNVEPAAPARDDAEPASLPRPGGSSRTTRRRRTSR